MLGHLIQNLTRKDVVILVNSARTIPTQEATVAGFREILVEARQIMVVVEYREEVTRAPHTMIKLIKMRMNRLKPVII